MTRLDSERNVWMATVRPDGRPHLTPIWFVWQAGTIWCCVSRTTTKLRNLEINPAVSLSLESGNAPLVAEGRVTIHSRPYPDTIVEAVAAKYEWNITRGDDDGDFDALLEITVDRWLMGDPSLDD